ncbi:cold-shock protein [Lactobacillus corticis]|uniref:Cold-shock protein n=1 Tax=Lactobacillus corticis TaxID=2201249 RepID=A0A916QLA9_9LACO|nr:cold shock domain-containing protein [Lactobacillus corticis]GFZ27741.1 cold-shock protein [Lactobacillus corticis]
MRTGTVKQFDQGSPFGFVKDDLNGKSYFVFYKAIKEEGYKSLNVGDRVRYQLAQGKNGLQCINVYLTNSKDKD